MDKKQTISLMSTSLASCSSGGRSDKIEEFIIGCRQISWATWSIEIVFSLRLACGCEWQESRWSFLRAMLQQRWNSSTHSQAQAIDQMTDSLSLFLSATHPPRLIMSLFIVEINNCLFLSLYYWSFHNRDSFLQKKQTFIYFIWTSRKKGNWLCFKNKNISPDNWTQLCWLFSAPYWLGRHLVQSKRMLDTIKFDLCSSRDSLDLSRVKSTAFEHLTMIVWLYSLSIKANFAFCCTTRVCLSKSWRAKIMF